MSDLFKNILRHDESLFSNEMALDYDYLPPIIKFRENEQQHIATCLKPLFQGRSGRNVLILGTPGIGKTAAVRTVLRDLENETDEIQTIYVNCWKKDSPFKIACDICEQIGYSWTHNKRIDELMKAAAQILNRSSAVFVFDEFDKLGDQGILYTLLEDIQRKAIILITNDMNFLAEIDNRVRSRLTPELLEFKPYKLEEVDGILKQRVEFAFVPNTVELDARKSLSDKTFELADLRSGLYLLREAGLSAETSGSRKVAQKHVDIALSKLADFKAKAVAFLDDEEKAILDLVKNNSGLSTKELFVYYQKADGKKSYRTFQRKVKDLAEANFISKKDIYKGADAGRTTIIDYISSDKL